VSLTFLTADLSAARGVTARSPMEQLAQAAGARMTRQEGWRVAIAYAEPTVEHRRMTRTVAFADRSHLLKLEIQAEPLQLAKIVAHASGDLELQAGTAARSPGTWWCPVTPARALVVAEPDTAAAVRAAIARATEETGTSATVVDLTSGLAALALIGPGARELIARFCAIDVRAAVAPPGTFLPGSVARTPGYVLVESQRRLLLLVGWALGEYLWQVVADAAEHLGGGPVGSEALRHDPESADA